MLLHEKRTVLKNENAQSNRWRFMLTKVITRMDLQYGIESQPFPGAKLVYIPTASAVKEYLRQERNQSPATFEKSNT